MNIEDLTIEDIAKFLVEEKNYENVIIAASKRKFAEDQNDDQEIIESVNMGGVGCIGLLEILKHRMMTGEDGSFGPPFDDDNDEDGV